MNNPLVTAVEELGKVLELSMRFIQPEDVDDFAEEVAKLGIENGFGARAKAAAERHATLSPREIRMARFLAGDGLKAYSSALTMLNVFRFLVRDNPLITVTNLMIAGIPADSIEDVLKGAVSAHDEVGRIHSLLISNSKDNPIGDFTEAEAVIIREAK